MKLSDRVAVAISGGVESAVAAALLKNQGFDVEGVHFKITPSCAFESRCSSAHLTEDAVKICEQLDISCHIIDASDLFEHEVIDPFIHDYLQDRLPSPCVSCDKNIKFKLLEEKADQLKCTWVATGHYAQVIQDVLKNRAVLLQALDAANDQSYFLYSLSQKTLQRTLMPLGGLMSEKVLKLGIELGIEKPNPMKSQEFCNVGQPGYEALIEKRSSPHFRSPGTIRTVHGEIVGQHAGLYHYSIGQKPRENLSIENPHEYYVAGYDVLNQALIVGKQEMLYHKDCMIQGLTWVRAPDGVRRLRCLAKINPRHEAAQAHVTLYEGSYAQVEFDEPQRAITPGQAIVFYEGAEVLGGGIIEHIGGISV